VTQSPSSSERKFARGVEQVKALRGEAKAFEDGNAYVFRKEIESRTANSIRYRCFATEREAPSDEWPLLAGEAIQNIRAALDHVVWASVKRPSTKTAFPIFTDPCEFQVIGGQSFSNWSWLRPPANLSYRRVRQPTEREHRTRRFPPRCPVL
jgi:hypothetical protein